MAMRLLQKQEIDNLKSREFRRDREEGLKLARRVDALRQILPQEEATLQKWRTDTLSKIHEEIKKVSDEREVLLGEVRRLSFDRLEALKPITRELSELEAKRSAIEEREKTIKEREEKINEKESEIRQSRDLCALELKKAYDERKRASDLLEEAAFSAHASRLLLAESEAKRDMAEEVRVKLEKEFTERGARLFAGESSLKIKEENLSKREKGLEVGIRRLEDQRATLARAMARLKK